MNLRKILSAVLACAVLLGSTALTRFDSADISAAGTKSRVSVHDPSIFKDENGTYYVFGSHIDAAKSTDLQNWKTFTNGYNTPNNVIFGDLSRNLAGAFAWAGEDLEDCAGGFAVWAPDVVYNPDFVNSDGTKGAYMMYFCVSSTYIRSAIAYAVSQNPEGPYTYVDTLIYSGFTPNDAYVSSSTKNVNIKYTSTNVDELIASGEVTYNNNWFSGNAFNNTSFPNAIDPTIYYDTDGRMYMCYGSWSGGIFTLEIDPKTGKCIHPRSGKTEDGRLIDSYFGTNISGGYRKSGEGPFIEYNPDNGYYYLWVTYGGLVATGGYNMRVFRSKSPTGPFVDAAGRNAVLESNTSLDSVGLKVMGNHKFSSLSTAYMACGHNSVLCDDDGQWYLFNHTRFNGGTEYHEVRVHAMYFNSDDWPVVAPYEYSGDVLSAKGYNESDIIGSYEFIDHGTDTSGTIHNYVNISLNADGTISGDVNGTWKQALDSAEAVITIDGTAYYGYFLAQQDESGTGKRVMSFTAVGSSNKTVWGVKTSAFLGQERTGYVDFTNSQSKLVYAPETIEDLNGSLKIGDTDLLSGVPYYITNRHSGLVLDLADGSTTNGTNIQQWGRSGGAQQEWRLIALDNGYCRIVSMADESKCITVEESSAENGINVSLASYNGGDNQQWRLIKDGSYYGIVSKCSNDTAGLDVYDWSTKNGGNINQWEFWGGNCQRWSITPVYPEVTEGTYTIRNVNSGKWITTDGKNVLQNSASEKWSIVKLTDGTYQLLDRRGYALTVETGTGDDGSNVSVSQNIDTDAQKFTIRANKDGSYSVMSVVSDGSSCLDVYEVSSDDGANICQWSYWDGLGQHFVLEPALHETSVIGDVNADGKFSAADLVMMHKYILGVGELTDPQAGDLIADGTIDVFDLVVMRRLLFD